MTVSQPKVRFSDKPLGADEFKLIRGIGPSIECRLYNTGILTYDQLASLSPEDIVESLGDMIGLTTEKVKKQDWIGQARQLAATKEETGTEIPSEESDSSDRLHYATFTVELLINEENEVRRTRIIHVQSLEEKSWAGLDQKALVEFLVSNGNIKINSLEVPGQSFETEPDATAEEQIILDGDLGIREIKTIPSGTDTPRRTIPGNQPFDIYMTIDSSQLIASHNVALSYNANIYARRLGNRTRIEVGQVEGSFTPFEMISISMEEASLPAGTYRLEAEVELHPVTDGLASSSGLKTVLEGNLLQVY